MQGFGSAFIWYGSGSRILGWIRIQSGSRDLMTKNWKKIYSWKKLIFLLKTTIYLSLGFHKGRPSYKRSFIKREHPAIQNMKFLNFVLLLWVIFALLDPDPDSEYGSRSTDNPGSVFGKFLPGSYLGSIFIFLLNFLQRSPCPTTHHPNGQNGLLLRYTRFIFILFKVTKGDGWGSLFWRHWKLYC